MTTRPTRDDLRKWLWLVLAACALTNVWYRGPFFGLILLVFVAPPPLVLTAILWRARISKKVLVPAALLSSFAMSWIGCSPPSTARLFNVELGCPLPGDVDDLMRYDDTWGIDPSYCFRFRTSTASGENMADCIALQKIESSAYRQSTFELLNVRDWWKPAEMQDPQVWKGRRYDWYLELWHEPASGLVYLWLYTT